MNFPSEDILKVIGKEFPDSEFVISSATNAQEYRWKVPSHFIKYNCPTCEELGEWLENKEDDYGRVYLVHRSANKGIWFAMLWASIKSAEKKCIRSFEVAFQVEAKTETQARAIAVKTILEEK